MAPSIVIPSDLHYFGFLLHFSLIVCAGIRPRSSLLISPASTHHHIILEEVRLYFSYLQLQEIKCLP